MNAEKCLSIASAVAAVVSAIVAAASFATLAYERRLNNRPYLQVGFELIRDDLACVVLQNTGSVSLEVTRLDFASDFIVQIEDPVQRTKLGNREERRIVMLPRQKLVIPLHTTVGQIVREYKVKTLHVDFRYRRSGDRRIYKDSADIDFTQYGEMLLYRSELDEIRKELAKIDDALTKIVNKS